MSFYCLRLEVLYVDDAGGINGTCHQLVCILVHFVRWLMNEMAPDR